MGNNTYQLHLCYILCFLRRFCSIFYVDWGQLRLCYGSESDLSRPINSDAGTCTETTKYCSCLAQIKFPFIGRNNVSRVSYGDFPFHSPFRTKEQRFLHISRSKHQRQVNFTGEVQRVGKYGNITLQLTWHCNVLVCASLPDYEGCTLPTNVNFENRCRTFKKKSVACRIFIS